MWDANNGPTWVSGEVDLGAVGISTLEPVDVSFRSATLKGSINQIHPDYQGEAIKVWFEKDGVKLEGSESTLYDAGTFDHTITNLEPGATYNYKAKYSIEEG